MLPRNKQTVKQTVLIGLVLLALAFAAFFVLHVVRVILLVFAAIVIAVFLRGCGNWLCRRLKVSSTAGVAITVLGVIVFFGLSFWIIAPRVASQLSDLQVSLPQIVHKMTGGHGQLKSLLRQGTSGFANVGKLSSRVSDGVVNVIVIAFVSIYLAFQPSVYRKGLMALVPPPRRPAFGAVLDRLEITLRRWFLGRIVGMAAIGVMVGIAMWAMGMPLAFALGLIAGVFEFVPYLGAFISAIPAVLLALDRGPTMAWIVVAVFLVVHGIDGYIVIPVVERRAVHLAPGLTIVVQVTMYITMGILGVLVADPLTASILVLLQRFYIRQSPPELSSA